MKPGSGRTSAWPLWSVWWKLPSSLLPSCSGFLPLIHQRGKVPDLSGESNVRRSHSFDTFSHCLASFIWWSSLQHGCWGSPYLSKHNTHGRARTRVTDWKLLASSNWVSASSSNKASKTHATRAKTRKANNKHRTNNDSTAYPKSARWAPLGSDAWWRKLASGGGGLLAGVGKSSTRKQQMRKFMC